MADVVDEERNQFLRELVGPVVVGAVGHDSRHSVGVMEGTHEMVGAGLAGTVWRVRIVLGGLIEEILSVSLVVL